LIKLKKNWNDGDDGSNINVEIEVSFEDRNGKKYKNEQTVMFETKNDQNKGMNDMIEDEKEDGINADDDLGNFYDNLGIRKAILLCKYVDLMQKWIDNTNSSAVRVNDEYKALFADFLVHFKREKKECDDEDLQKEVDLMEQLIVWDNTKVRKYPSHQPHVVSKNNQSKNESDESESRLGCTFGGDDSSSDESSSD